jgi:hypothetical protein
MQIRSPWPGENVEVVDARTSAVVLAGTPDPVLSFTAREKTAYLLKKTTEEKNPLQFEGISGERAIKPKSLGVRTIGIAK